MTSFESLSSSQRIRAALHRDVRGICTETCHFLGLEISKPAMEIVAELVFKKLSTYGTDLEAFAKHAKRTTVNSDDVKLLVRRNNSLKSHLNSLASTPSTVKEKRRKTLPIKQPETPSSKPKDPETPLHKEPRHPTHKEQEHLILKELWDTRKETVGTKESEEEKQDLGQVESMAVDDTIDLTFD